MPPALFHSLETKPYPSITWRHLSNTFCFSSGVDSATGEKSFIHSKGARGVDDSAEVEALLARPDARVERAAPAAPQDVDGVSIFLRVNFTKPKFHGTPD